MRTGNTEQFFSIKRLFERPFSYFPCSEFHGSHERDVILDHIVPFLTDSTQAQMAMKIDAFENLVEHLENFNINY
jgi:hypothetical protein